MPLEIPGLAPIASTIYKLLLAKGINYLLSKLERARPQTLRGHYSELISSLSKMPFIYKDLTTLVLKDFADIKFEHLDLTTLDTRKKEQILRVTMEERIRNRPKALFLGNAGIGKTTFFRYTVLSLVTSSPTAEHFSSAERLVPFYIPLKAVNNTKPHPVLTYLLQSHKYLAGPRGFNRLLRLAQQKRLFLLLDGYDEIYLPPSTQTNFLVDELTMLLSSRLPPYGTVRIDKKFRGLYEELCLCRTWLSSRREFYALHSLGFADDHGTRTETLDLIALSISGLHNRSLLVGKIFDIYRTRADLYRDRLSEESFLQDIDLTGDDDLIALSFNPLFLTVMCYIHAQNLKADTEIHTDYRQATMSDLILGCIGLLLRDLDFDKVREVPAAQRQVFREVFEKRRSLYKEEKEAFLGYFANRLLSDGIQVFDEHQLSEAARDFFRTEYREGRADEILRSLEASSRSEHNFVRQLLNQGVFVLVRKTGEGKVFDFPHRRFREVLAAQYLNTPERVKHVVENLHNPQYAEFIYVFFSVAHYQNQILEQLLGRVDSSERGQHFGVLAVNCLRVKPRHYDATPVLLNWVRARLDSRVPFQMPRQALDHLFPNREAVNWLSGKLREALDRGDEHVLAIVGPILIKANKPESIGTIAGGFNAIIRKRRAVGTLLDICAEVDPDWILERLDKLKGDLQVFRSLLVVYARLHDEEGGARVWTAIMADLSFEQRVVLADVAQRVNPAVIARVDEDDQLADELELLAVLARHVRGLEPPLVKEAKRSGLPRGREIYVITQSVLRVAEDAPMRQALRRFMGEVHTSDEFLPEMERGTRKRIAEAARRDTALIDKVAKILARSSGEEEKVVKYFY